MPWFMVDDAITTDEKVLALELDVRAEVMGTWMLCGAWSSQRLKDGVVPDNVVTAMGGTIKGAELLVSVGLWKRRKDGYVFVNWAKYQRTRAQVMKKRADDAERQANRRRVKPQAEPEDVTDLSQRDIERVTVVSTSPIPSHPIPSHPLPGESERGGSRKHDAGTDAPPTQRCGEQHPSGQNCSRCGDLRKADKQAESAQAKAAKTTTRRTELIRSRRAIYGETETQAETETIIDAQLSKGAKA